MNTLCLEIIMKPAVSGLIHISVFHAILFESLRRKHEKQLAIKLEQIRAFPHIAKVRHAQTIMQLPVRQMIRPVQKDETMIVLIARAQHHIIHAIFFENFRIAHMP